VRRTLVAKFILGTGMSQQHHKCLKIALSVALLTMAACVPTVQLPNNLEPPVHGAAPPRVSLINGTIPGGGTFSPFQLNSTSLPDPIAVTVTPGQNWPFAGLSLSAQALDPNYGVKSLEMKIVIGGGGQFADLMVSQVPDAQNRVSQFLEIVGTDATGLKPGTANPITLGFGGLVYVTVTAKSFSGLGTSFTALYSCGPVGCPNSVYTPAPPTLIGPCRAGIHPCQPP
jgi:hypothetical protein